MNNIQKAKEKLEEGKNLEAIINPKPGKRVKLPLQRDVNLIESILNKKLDDKAEKFKENLLGSIKNKYSKEFEQIHLEAIALKRKAEQIGREIENENNGNVQAKYLHDNYDSSYLSDLPEDMDSATEHDLFEIKDSTFPKIEKMKKEIDEYVLNVKIGLAPFADVKALLAKIDEELK